MYESVLAICTTILVIGCAWLLFKAIHALAQTPMKQSEIWGYMGAFLVLAYFAYIFVLMLPFP